MPQKSNQARDDVLRRMLKTPPTTYKPLGKRQPKFDPAASTDKIHKSFDKSNDPATARTDPKSTKS
jgi:hypothetical protein